LSRLELVGETLRVALEELAAAAPDWLAGVVTAEWSIRYGRPVRYDRLPRRSRAAIDRNDSPAARPQEISSRSISDNRNAGRRRGAERTPHRLSRSPHG
jgi:hypothetical protein